MAVAEVFADPSLIKRKFQTIQIIKYFSQFTCGVLHQLKKSLSLASSSCSCFYFQIITNSSQ